MDEKLRFVHLARSGRFTITELCQDFGITRKTGHKYLQRYLEHGASGLQELSLLGAVAGPDIDDYSTAGNPKGLGTLEMNAYRFRPNEPITMGEFSQMTVNGLQIPLSITASHFIDVPRGHPAYKYIETLYDYSTQSKQPFFDFEPSEDFVATLAHPDKKVNGAQAAKILSGLLKKSTPAWHTPNANLSRGEAAQLVYQHVK
jgi:hypothetical protein